MEYLPINNINSDLVSNSFQDSTVNTEENKKMNDDEFISFINGLNQSIKEYYKVSKKNILEANTFLNSYEQKSQYILKLMNLMIKSNNFDHLDEFFQQIPNILEVLSLIKGNVISNNNNLNLFFNDAKIIFNKMKLKRQEKLHELNNFKYKKINLINSNNSNNNNNTNNNNNKLYKRRNSTSDYGENNKSNKTVLFKNNLKAIINQKINNDNNVSLFENINNIYSRIVKLLNEFGEYNLIISKIDLDKSNKFNNLKNNVKNELDNLMKAMRDISGNNQLKILQTAKSYNIIKNNNFFKFNKTNNDTQNDNQQEKLKKIFNNQLSELNNQLNAYKKRLAELDKENNNINNKLTKVQLKLKEKDKIILNLKNDKNNNSINKINNELKDILNKKDLSIKNLENQLNIYQKNEKEKINTLNSQFNEIMFKYENKINKMKENTEKDQMLISKLKNELYNKQGKKNSLREEQEQRNIDNINNLIEDDSKKIINNNTCKVKNVNNNNELKEMAINFKNQEKVYKKEIENLENIIALKENLIKQKDEIINNRDITNNKLSNDNLKKQLVQQKNINSSVPSKRLNDLNINTDEINEIQNNLELEKKKSKELELELQKSKEYLLLSNESKHKMEKELVKKGEELDGLKIFIKKLQNQIEQKDEIDNVIKKNLVKLYDNALTEQNNTIRSNSQGKIKNVNAIIMRNYLEKLKERDKKIALLENQNKELNFKLEEKQVQNDYFGYRTEEFNFATYEEEFDFPRIVNGVKMKNQSEDINIDYPEVELVKNKYKELNKSKLLLEEQVRILISNISFNKKIKPQITQICQLMGIPGKYIQDILDGKDKKKILGLIV